MRIRSLLITVVFAHATIALGGDATTIGSIFAPYPTVVNLAVTMEITGDDDLDGVVSVRFREQGTTPWRAGLPLRRIPGGTNESFTWTNKHSGSIFGLKPDTTYEIELTLDDPDGGSGVRTLTATTRPVPYAPDTATEIPVTPATFSAAASTANPGDILLLGAGTYSTFVFGRDGAAGNPIVIRSATPLAAVIDGDVRLDNRSHVYLEGVTVNGKIKFNTASDLVIRRCVINAVDYGIVSYGAGATNCYIADNVLNGPYTWTDPMLGAGGTTDGEGIQLAGPGNVICYNRVSAFRDCLSTMEDASASNQVCVDMYGNDIYLGCDDGIEADFTMGNCRVMDNRLTNCYVGLSAQPTLGGPMYFIRNAMYNIVYAPFKLHRASSGDVALHNTVVKCGDSFACYTGEYWSHALFRNNIFIGSTGGGTFGGFSNDYGRVVYLEKADTSCSFDYDAYGYIGSAAFTGRIGDISFSSFAEMVSTTTEVHAAQVDLSVFAAAVSSLTDGPFPERSVPDLRLASPSAATDAGVLLPNINDDYTGTAPDLGAYETALALPAYGVRAEGVDENTPFEALLPPDADPVVTFTAPVALSTLSGTLTVNAVAHDSDVGTNNGNGVEHVTFQLLSGGTPADTYQDDTAPYEWALDTTAHADGPYTLTATALSTTAAGDTSSSDQMAVVIDNASGGDTDGDALPDDWELTHFGDLDETAAGDPDGDGVSNYDEYVAGTLPDVNENPAINGNDGVSCSVSGSGASRSEILLLFALLSLAGLRARPQTALV